MSTIDDYCDFCELPLSTCIHGNPPAPPPEPVRKTAASRAKAAAAGPTRTVMRASTGAAPPPPRPRRRTPAEDFEPHILEVLESLGGEGPAEEVMDAIGERLVATFRPGDTETGPTGEVRWRTACRTARKQLSDQGRLVAPSPGVWRLP